MTDPEEIITLLSDHEEAIGNLYSVFASLFPDQQGFWEDCAREEFRHAQMVHVLRDLLLRGRIQFAGRFHAQALRTSMKYIREQIKLANDKQTSLVEAYAAALNIENSLLENRYFESFSSADPDFLAIKKTLVEETMRHRNQVRSAWQDSR